MSSRSARSAGIISLLLLTALLMPQLAHAGTAWVSFYKGPNAGDPENVWKSKNMTSNGKFTRAQATVKNTGCLGDVCVYGYLSIPGNGQTQGVAPTYASFKYVTGTFECMWSVPGQSSKNRTPLRCYVGVPSS